jgi:nitrate reductase cytochrome c-type subunit
MSTRRRKLAAAGAAAILVGGVALAIWLWTGRRGEASASAFEVRAARRAYDGAPPVIPHPPLGGSCTTCHASTAHDVPGVGIAPPNPHLRTPGVSEASRCRQCHVFQSTTDLFVGNDFEGLPQRPRRGERLYEHAPPVLPHGLFMREACTACHAGPAAREEIRCSHAERANCLQCHALRSDSESVRLAVSLRNVASSGQRPEAP